VSVFVYLCACLCLSVSVPVCAINTYPEKEALLIAREMDGDREAKRQSDKKTERQRDKETGESE
jgi:hypothetical protein